MQILLQEVARQIRTYADAEAQKLGMTLAQLRILARLERRGDVSQSELADVAEVAPMTIARLVDRLEELGLLERYADPSDRRIWRPRLTAAAARIFHRFNRLQSKLHGAMTRGVDPAVLEAMVVGLHRIKENVSARRWIEQTQKVGA